MLYKYLVIRGKVQNFTYLRVGPGVANMSVCTLACKCTDERRLVKSRSLLKLVMSTWGFTGFFTSEHI